MFFCFKRGVLLLHIHSHNSKVANSIKYRCQCIETVIQTIPDCFFLSLIYLFIYFQIYRSLSQRADILKFLCFYFKFQSVISMYLRTLLNTFFFLEVWGKVYWDSNFSVNLFAIYKHWWQCFLVRFWICLCASLLVIWFQNSSLYHFSMFHASHHISPVPATENEVILFKQSLLNLSKPHYEHHF